jgi:lysozyme
LIKETDEEYGCEVDTPVSPERVQEAFEDDVQSTYNDCVRLYSDFDMLPTEAQLIIGNMMFNMGLTRLSKFKLMKKAVDNRDFEEAAAQMKDSKWYSQVTNRADRLVSRMKSLA